MILADTKEKIISFIESDKPLDIEIGFGKGAFILGKAALYPNINFIGYEIRMKWVKLVEKRSDLKGLENTYVEYSYANESIPKQIPSGRVRNIYVNFPDPWWKRKHKKRRILKKEFINLFYNSLMVGGRIYARSDVKEYIQTTERVFSELENFVQVEHDIIDDVMSDREIRCKDVGLPTYNVAFEKIK